MSLRLIAVHAHPDDESSKGAATYAHYLERGCEVLVVSCTGGELGDVLNPAVAVQPAAHRDLAGMRRTEMARAKEIIGFQHLWLGYHDSGLPATGQSVHPHSFAGLDPELSCQTLVRVVREFRPHVMITYNEMGGYPHPDHIRCHEISKMAWERSGDATYHPELGQPWEISKLYYDEIFNAERVRVLYEFAVAADPDSAVAKQLLALHERFAARPINITARINVGRLFEKRDAALRAHASQVEPDNQFFFIPNQIQRDAWPTEDFRLAYSRVPVTEFETDLFAGINEEIS